MLFLKQSTAVTLKIGPFVDDSDGVTAETALTISQADVRLSKNGGNYAQKNESSAATHDELGEYDCDLDATDTNTLGVLRLSVQESGACPVWHDFMVLPANVYDSLCSTDKLQVDVNEVSGDSTAADNLEAMYDGTGYTDDTGPASRGQVGGIAILGGVLNQVAGSFNLTTGTVISGSYADTVAENDTEHQIEDAAGTLDCYYEMDVSSIGVGSGVVVIGRVNGGNDDLTMYAYDWVGTDWEEIRSYDGQVSTANNTRTAVLLAKHTGTGANAGKVRIRFQGTGLTSADLYIDQIYVTYAIQQSVLGYEGGAIWIDTVNGSAGAVSNVNGTADNPVDNIADANTLAAAIGLDRFVVAPGSSITFAASQQNQIFLGESWTLALGGQDIAGTRINGATVSGIQTGSGAIFVGCTLGNCTVADCSANGCAISGTLTLSAAGDYFFDSCYSAVAGQGTPTLDINSVADVDVNWRHYSGGLQVDNAVATTTMSYEADGQIVIDASCTSLTISIRGCCQVTDNGTTSSITQEAAINRTNINAEADTAIADASLATAANLAVVDGVADDIKAVTVKLDDMLEQP